MIHIKKRYTKQRKGRKGSKTKKSYLLILLSSVVAIFFIVVIVNNTSKLKESISDVKTSSGEIRTKHGKKRLSPSSNCMESKLVRNQKPIFANSSLGDESVQDFSILLYPRSKDRYISSTILKNGSYEPEMAEFISNALTVDKKDATEIWAVDIGSNVGFHSLHMARRGANVISFEAAPDTAALFKCSVELNYLNSNDDPKNDSNSGTSRTNSGSITVIQAGASDVKAVGVMSRHPDSPGMTSFTSNSSFPLEALKMNGAPQTASESKEEIEPEDGGKIQLVRVEDILIEKGIPQMDSERLRLLKVDVEGFELRAFKGLNLERYPFLYVTFEFFPKMLRDAGTDPVDLLMHIYAKYDCGLKPSKMPSRGSTLTQTKREEMNEWIDGIKNHVNIYCRLKATV